jgi:CPA1 family monovalent cation:H+ antiporter
MGAHDEIAPGTIAAGLANVPLFAGLTAEELDAVASRVEVRAYPPETAVVAEGEPGEEFFLVLEGAVRVARHGVEQARLGPGEFFGEMALITGQPRSATVESLGEALLGALSRQAFLALTQARPAVRRKVHAVARSRVEHGRR